MDCLFQYIFGTSINSFIEILLFKTHTERIRAPSIFWSISTFSNVMFIVIMLTNNEKLWPWKSCWKIMILIYNYLWRESCDHWLVMTTIKWRNSQKTPSLVVHKNVWRYGIPYRHIKLRLMQYMNNNAILSILEMHFWYSAFVYFLGRLISIYIVSAV